MEQSELSFLLDLLLNEKLSKAVKTRLTDRIKLIEASPTHVFVPRGSGVVASAPPAPVQPSTAAASEALAKRQELISQAVNGKAPQKNRSF